MFVFNVLKATQVTNISIVIPFVCIGEIGVSRLLLLSLNGQKLHVAPNKRDNVARHCCHGPYSAHVISKWGTAPWPMSMSKFVPALTSPMPSVEGTCQKTLLHWDSKLLDGQHLECVTCHKLSGGMGRLQC